MPRTSATPSSDETRPPGEKLRKRLDALEQILVRCILHTHRSKLWAPRHRRPLAQTSTRHRPILAALAAHDGAGLARALEHHVDTIVDVAPAERAS